MHDFKISLFKIMGQYFLEGIQIEWCFCPVEPIVYSQHTAMVANGTSYAD